MWSSSLISALGMFCIVASIKQRCRLMGATPWTLVSLRSGTVMEIDSSCT